MHFLTWFSNTHLQALLPGEAFLSLLAILQNSAFRWVYLSFPPLPLASLLFSALCKASSDNHFAFCISFYWGWSWSLPPVQCHELLFILLQALCPSDLIPWIYLSLPLYNCKGFDSGHTWMVFPIFFNVSLNFSERRSSSEPQSAPSLVFADCIELLNLWLQRI